MSVKDVKSVSFDHAVYAPSFVWTNFKDAPLITAPNAEQSFQNFLLVSFKQRILIDLPPKTHEARKSHCNR